MNLLHSFLSFFKSTYEYDPTERDTSKDIYNTKQEIIENDIIASIDKAFVGGVAGKCLKFDCNGIDEDINKIVNKIFKRWKKIGNCEITKRFDFDFMIDKMVTQYKIFGGVLVRHHFNIDEFEFGYKFELIDIRRVDTDFNGSGWINGFKLGKYGEIQAIRVKKSDDSSISVNYNELSYFTSPYDDIHRYSPLTELAPMKDSAKNIYNYNNSIVKTQEQASKRGVIIGSETYATQLQLYMKELQAATRDNNQNKINEYTKKIADLSIQSLDKDIQYVPKGSDVHNLNVTNNINIKDLNEETKKIIASSIGLSNIDLFNDAPRSYLSALTGLKKSDSTYEKTARDLFTHIIEPILINFAKGLYYKKIIEKEDFLSEIYEYVVWEYLRESLKHIDPSKTAKAIDTELKNKTTTYKQVAGERGQDWQELIEQQVKEESYINDMRKKYNLGDNNE